MKLWVMFLMTISLTAAVSVFMFSRSVVCRATFLRRIINVGSGQAVCHSAGFSSCPFDADRVSSNRSSVLVGRQRDWPRIRQIKLHFDIADGLELRERRQLVETPQAEIVEEVASGSEELWTSRDITVTHYADPIPLDHRLQDVLIDRNTAHRFDLSASDWLPIGNQCKCLEQCARVSGWTLGPQARDFVRQLAPHLNAEARGGLFELDATVRVFRYQRSQGCVNVGQLRPRTLIKQVDELRGLQWLAGCQ